MFVFQTSRANGPGRESSGGRCHQYIHNRRNIQSCEVKVPVYRDVIDAKDSFRLIEYCYYHPSACMCLVQSEKSGSRHTATPRLGKVDLTYRPSESSQTIGKGSENLKAFGDVDCRKRIVGNEMSASSNVFSLVEGSNVHCQRSSDCERNNFYFPSIWPAYGRLVGGGASPRESFWVEQCFELSCFRALAPISISRGDELVLYVSL